jgi:TolB-like protein/tetratricopeptide (TPR) repeat protein
MISHRLPPSSHHESRDPLLPASHRGARYEFDDVVVDPDNYRIYKGGILRPIGPRAFDLLLDLLVNAGRAVDKQELFDRVWKGATVTDNALTRAVRQLRQVIGDRARAPRYIETVARRGYRFAAAARCVPKSSTVRLAVLPFEDLSPTPDECFTDGLVEELITQLGQANPEQLAVTARGSATSYQASSKNLTAIGRELAVDYVLQGSVRRTGTRARLSVQLARVSDGSVSWSTSYDVEARDSLCLQENVAEHVTRQIHIRLARSGQTAQRESVDPEAHAAFLRARYFLGKRTADGLRRATEAFEEAAMRAPNMARAHVGLAQCHASSLAGLNPHGSGNVGLARAAVARALEVDNHLADAHALLGLLHAAAWDFAAAERSLRWAIALDPNDPGPRHWLAMFPLVVAGRFDEALEELTRARRLDPLSLIVHADMAAVFYLNREFDRAIAQCGTTLDLDPYFARAHLYRGLAWAATGHAKKASAAIRTAYQIDDSPWTLAWLGYARAIAGERVKAADILRRQLRRIESGRGGASHLVALVYAGLGEIGAAVTWFERAFAERSIWLPSVEHFAAFDGLRHDRRFEHLLRRVRAALSIEGSGV